MAKEDHNDSIGICKNEDKTNVQEDKTGTHQDDSDGRSSKVRSITTTVLICEGGKRRGSSENGGREIEERTTSK